MYYVEYKSLSSYDYWTRMGAYDTYEKAYQAIKKEQANDEKSNRRIVYNYQIVKTEVCYTTEI